MMKAVNPANGETIAEYPTLDEQQLRQKLDQAGETFRAWRKTSFAERADRMRQAAKVVRQQQGRLATLMTQEMGKPITQAEGEVEKCAWVCDYYAEHAEQFLASEVIETDASRSLVRYDPLGVVLAVMPWNFPFWQVFRFAAPGLMAGNVGVLKHASNVPGCALAIEEIFLEAGFPAGAFTTLLIPSQLVDQAIAHPAVKAVTLTGSEGAGAAVAATAGKQLKKTVLELGGSDPFIVLADADLPATAAQAAKGRTINAGQSCIAAKRFLVEESVADSFEQLLAQEMEQLACGDPQDRATQMGPLARADLADDLHRQVTESVAAGARLLAGGERTDTSSCYYPATVLAGVTPGMPVFDQETFGPVAAVVRVPDRQQAVELANRSPYGLGASVWTSDPVVAEQMAAEIESGAVFINGIVKSDPRLPFGGVKQSGYGRELADVGIREFVNIKTVWIR